jgi:putative restriction endonuclease
MEGGSIWKPKQMEACLGLLRSHSNKRDHYDPVQGVINFTYPSKEGHVNRNDRNNKSIRLAMDEELPVLYLRAVNPQKYQVDIVRVVGEAPDKQSVKLQVIGEMNKWSLSKDKTPEADAPPRPSRHLTAQVPIRHDQSYFRGQVMGAYKNKCAVCRLQQRELLEAAHIIPYAEGGESKVDNGLSLCRIHHGAYDRNILGIDQDYKIHIRKDLLEEKDGPMLEHGFKEMDQEHICQPTEESDKPDRDKLKQRYDQFRAAQADPHLGR